MYSLKSWAGSLLIGVRAALLFETRKVMHATQSRLESFGIETRNARTISRVLAYFSWINIVMSLVCSFIAPPLQRIFDLQTSDANGMILLICMGCVLFVLNVEAKNRRRHHLFLSLLSPASRYGFCSGSLLVALPIVVFTIKQAIHLQTKVLFEVVSIYVILLMLLLAFERKMSTLLVRVINLTAVAVALGLVTYYFDVSQWGVKLFALTIVQSLFAGLLTVLATITTSIMASWLGKHRLGPKDTKTHQKIGILVGLSLALSWVVTIVLQMSDRFSHLTGLILVTGIMLGCLLLRVHAARFTNPESLGMGLLLGRDLQFSGEKIVRFYRFNWVLLSLPLFVGGVLFLALQGTYSGIVLLFSLVFLELAVEEIAIQRQTVVLPSSSLNSLGIISRSGLGAGIALSIVCSVSGAVGVTPSIHLDENSLSVVIASLLFLVSAGVLMWLRYLDSDKWLLSIFCTPKDQDIND